MPALTTQSAQYGDSDNTLLLKIAAMVQAGGALVPTTLVFSTQPAGAVAGEPFTTQPVVTVKDQNGNTLTSFTGIVSLDATSDDPPFVMSGDTTIACVAGVATFTDLEINKAANYFLTASIASPALSVDSDSFAVLDADASAFFTAAGITDATQKNAVNTLVLDLKAASLWTPLLALYPFVGGTATPHSFNLKNPAQFQITWSGGVTHNANGITGNGTDGFGDCGISSNDIGAAGGLGMYINLMGTGNNIRPVGSITPDWYTINLDINDGDYYCAWGTPLVEIVGPVFAAVTAGSYGVNRTGATSLKMFKNGASVGTPNTDSVTPALTADPMYVLAANVAGPSAFFNGRIATARFHAGLTEAEEASMHSIINTFNTTLGRAA